MNRERPATPFSLVELLVVRLLNLPVAFACRALDFLVLLPRPRLLLAWLRLWALELTRSPFRWPRSFEAVLLLKSTGQSVGELVYGELPVFSALWLFWRHGLRRPGAAEGLLLDLGAGRGRPLLAARWLGAQARGLELLPEHVAAARLALGPVGVSVEQADMLQAPLGAPTHVLLNWCGLSDSSRARLEARLAGLPGVPRVFAVGVPPADPGWEKLGSHLLLFTWGFARVHVCRRREQPSEAGREPAPRPSAG